MSCEHDAMSRSTSRLGPEPVVEVVPGLVEVEVAVPRLSPASW